MSSASAPGDNGGDDDDKDSESSAAAPAEHQVRVRLLLSTDCAADRSLAVSGEPLAVPADITRRGLAAVVNHLLDRRAVAADDDEEEDDEEEEGENDDRLPALPFDFVVGKNGHRLLRTGVEREARRQGLSLEEAIPVTYFLSQRAPELSSDESEPLPDWISDLSCAATSSSSSSYLCAACYDGSVRVYQRATDDGGGGENAAAALNKLAVTDPAAGRGPLRCLDAAAADQQDCVWMASGSMDHSLQVHRLKQGGLQAFGTCEGGHASAIASVDLFLKGSSKLLASGDWEGGVCLWDLSAHPDDAVGEEEQATKRTKTSSAPSSRSVSVKALSLTPTVSLQAHNSPVSGLSWGNCEKRLEAGRPDRLITGSWDRSVKVWDVERQDCLLTLAGSRVVTCLDTSHRASGIVATGHPDCTVRLWDVRTDKKEDSLTVTDSTFRPSHKAWVSSVQWSPHSPYHVTSTGHDGTVKLWDIRSSLPLHTVRAFAKGDKGLCLAYSPGTTENGYTIFAGGTDCAVKQVQSAGLPKQ